MVVQLQLLVEVLSALKIGIICQEPIVMVIDVFNKMTKTALDEEISNYVAYHRYYQRLIAVKIAGVSRRGLPGPAHGLSCRTTPGYTREGYLLPCRHCV